MDYVKKLGSRKTLEGKRIYTGLAYEIETGHNRCFAQIVNDQVEHSKDIALLNNHRLKLERSVSDFYSQIQFANIGWQLLEYDPPKITFDKEDAARYKKYKNKEKEAISDGTFKAEGYMEVSSLKELLEGPKGEGWLNILWFDSMDKWEKEFWQQYMVFDYSVSECFILLKKENGVIRDNLYYYYNGNHKPIDMHMTVDKYLDIACKVKVFKGWQYALTKEPLDRGETLRQMKHYLPQIFPTLEFDFSDFQ